MQRGPIKLLSPVNSNDLIYNTWVFNTISIYCAFGLGVRQLYSELIKAIKSNHNLLDITVYVNVYP